MSCQATRHETSRPRGLQAAGHNRPRPTVAGPTQKSELKQVARNTNKKPNEKKGKAGASEKCNQDIRAAVTQVLYEVWGCPRPVASFGKAALECFIHGRDCCGLRMSTLAVLITTKQIEKRTKQNKTKQTNKKSVQ